MQLKNSVKQEKRQEPDNCKSVISGLPALFKRKQTSGPQTKKVARSNHLIDSY